MIEPTKHARAFDLPGWPCPPRVRDIPNHENSWGLLMVYQSDNIHKPSAVSLDELGYLWVDGAAVPQYRLPLDFDFNPGAIVCWTVDGIGLWVHPKSLAFMGSISRLDMEPDRWLPVAVVLPELPPHVKDGTGRD